jgi:hypothetical protein
MLMNEKTLEINICTEIFYCHWRRHHQRILFFGPSLRQEAKKGYDIRAYGRGIRPFYIQYKSGKKKSTINEAVYTINNDSKNRQHQVLKALSRTSVVLYGLPLLFSMQDIEHGKWQLLKATEWVNVARMPRLPLPLSGEHEIHLNLTTRMYRIQSEEPSRNEQSVSWEKAYNLILETKNINSEMIIRENDDVIKEVLQGDEMPDDITSGLVFGAIL